MKHEERKTARRHDMADRCREAVPAYMVAIAKQNRNYIILKDKSEYPFFDYRKENDTDYYYIRCRLTDGHYAWSSPILVE